ncbi:MAG: hypothetical protein AB8G96_08595 [Phycisphaerales bacterium]
MDAVTAAGGRSASGQSCPYVDRGEARCARRFSLGHIDEAYRVCFGGFHGCSHYHEIRIEDDERAGADHASIPVVITLAGHAPVRTDPARIPATGT